MKSVISTLRIRAELMREFGFLSVRGVRIIKVEDRSVVLIGWLQGEKVIFKKYLTAKAASKVSQAAEELRFLERNLSEPYGVNRCIETAPEIGVIVLGWVPGKPVRRALADASASERREILQLSGGWVRQCAELRSRSARVRALKYLNRLRAFDLQLLSSADRELTLGMLGELGCLARQLKGKQTSHAIAHNDLTLMNIFYDSGRVSAIDINGAYWEPVARMAARFLVMKDLYHPPADTRLFHGLDLKDADLFLKSTGTDLAQRRVVKFFIGEQIVRIFLSRQDNTSRSSYALERMKAFLDSSDAIMKSAS